MAIFCCFFHDKIDSSSWIITKSIRPNGCDGIHRHCEFGGDTPSRSRHMSSLIHVLLHFEKWLYMMHSGPIVLFVREPQSLAFTYCGMALKSVKCYRGRRKIDLISSICEIQSHMRYHCVQYTKRHHISLLSHC